MPVRFILGPAGSGKTEHCISRLRGLERSGSPGVFLVPEQYTYTADRELLNTGEIAGLRHVRVLSFTRLAFWLRETFARPQPPVVPAEIRPLILRLVMNRMPDAQIAALLPMRHRSGFLEELGRFIGEVRNHGAQDFLDSIRREGEAPDKIRALAAVYEEYAGHLRRQGRIDPEQLLDGLEPLIAENATWISGWTIFVDGFLSWTRREREILISLALTGASMEVTFCLDACRSSDSQKADSTCAGCRPGDRRDSDSQDADTLRSPFIPVNRSLRRLRRSLDAVGIPTLPDLVMEPPADRRSGFERRLFATAGGDSSSPQATEQGADVDPSTLVPEIALQPARDPRQEVILWARQIDRWIRHDPDPVAPGRVAVILRNVDPYRDLIREIFPRYQIPFFLDERRSALVHPRVRLLLEALEICLGGWRRVAVISFLRNPLLGIAPATLDLLENLSLEYGRDYEAWLDTEWEEFILQRRERADRRGDDDAQDESDDDGEALVVYEDDPDPESEADGRMAYVEPVRLAALSPVRDLQQRWDDAMGQLPGSDAVAAVREMLSKLEAQGSQADPDPEWTTSVQASLERILQEMEALWPDVGVGLDEFARSLLLALRSLRIGVTPIRLNQVVVGDIQRSRLGGVECAVVGGLNDGEFPRTVKGDSVLAEQDRVTLEQLGIPLGPTASDRQEEEVYLFYIGLTRAAGRMLLTWRESESDGKAAEQSLLLEEALRAIPGSPGIPPSPTPGGEAEGDWQTPNELAHAAVSAAAEATPEAPPGPFMQALYNRLRSCRMEDDAGTLRDRSAGGGRGTAGARSGPALYSISRTVNLSLPALLYSPGTRLPEAVLRRLFPHPDIESSVSRLQGFSRCPFQSYARSLLRLEPRPQATISPLETGSLAHDVLERFFKGRFEPDPADVGARLNRIFEELKGHPAYRAFEVDEASRYRLQSTRNSLRRFLDLETARLARSPFQPEATEASFGCREGNPVIIPLDEERRLLLNGRIDRLDAAESGGGRRILVLDYKRSPQSRVPKNIEEGFDLQLAVYLMYIRDVLGLEAAGGFYLPVLPGPVAAERLRKDSPNPMGLRANGIALKAHWKEIDAGSGMLAGMARTDQALHESRLESLLDLARGHLKSHALNQRAGWIAAHPLGHPPGRLPCDYCDFAPICRFRRGRDPVRLKPADGMPIKEIP